KGNTNGERYIEITGDVEFTPGEIFSVVVEGRNVSVEGAGSDTVKYTSNSKESFYQTSDGKWHDCHTAGYNNTCVRAITKNFSSVPYTVKFVCPGNYEEKRIAQNGTVELPSTEGYTWQFTRNGNVFDGTGVYKDMIVEAHCYKTAGESTASSPCTKKFKCIYCGKDVIPPVTEHTYSVTSTTRATCTEDGYTLYSCSVCGYSYKDDIVPATGHTDADGDEICDNCGANTNPAANCPCICHKTGFAGFIYKIVRLFWKLFKIKQTCECGLPHW
ncbi:MAG: hypothetical protein ACI4SB_01830, partial [Acutalibacteraceae bacterium]